jgi:hypothetical protein
MPSPPSLKGYGRIKDFYDSTREPEHERMGHLRTSEGTILGLSPELCNLDKG